jgi:hypothetical protein
MARSSRAALAAGLILMGLYLGLTLVGAALVGAGIGFGLFVLEG